MSLLMGHKNHYSYTVLHWIHPKLIIKCTVALWWNRSVWIFFLWAQHEVKVSASKMNKKLVFVLFFKAARLKHGQKCVCVVQFAFKHAEGLLWCKCITEHQHNSERNCGRDERKDWVVDFTPACLIIGPVCILALYGSLMYVHVRS